MKLTKIVDLKEYKREKGIALPNSPYYTLNATEEQIQEAAERVSLVLEQPFDYRGVLPYAVLLGYENIKTGQVKLLKQVCIYPNRKVFESSAGIKGHKAVALVNKYPKVCEN